MNNNKLHVVHTLFRLDTGGLENGVVNLINHLPHDQYQHSIVTLHGVNPDFASRIINSNVNYFDLAKKPGQDFSIFWRLYKLLRKLKPDILHTRNMTTIECQISGYLARVKYRIHGEHGWDMSDLGGTNVKYQRIRQVLNPFIHRFISLSSESEDYLRNKVKVASRKLNRICNGVDFSRFSTLTTEVADMPDGFLTQDTLVFGAVGRLAKVKNQTLLLESFISLVQQYPKHKNRLRLLIVGDGELLEGMQKSVKYAQIEELVWFAGDRADVPALLNVMDVFVLPSLAEGISNTFLEAMAVGVPVIATNVGGNPDLMLPSHLESHLIPVNEQAKLTNVMARYVESSKLCKEEGQLVKEHCQENFSLDTMVEKYHQIYQQGKHR